MAKITVLMPTYNVASYVKEAIESVLQQTYSDLELLVMDDCSTDNTVEVVQSILDPRLRIEQNERNLGLADNLNRGLSLIHTELVARMDGDDIAEPNWLEEGVSVLDRHPEIGVCGGGFKRFGISDSLVFLPEKHEDIVVNMLFACSIVVPVFRYELFAKHFKHYRQDSFPAEDYRFWADCAEVTRFHNVRKVLFHYRMHESQICTSLKESQTVKSDAVRVLLLKRLTDNLSDDDIQFFLLSFTKNIIHDRKTLDEQYQFAEKLCLMNQEKQYYDSDALRRGLFGRIKRAVYFSVVADYFSKGYNLAAYKAYLKSGLAFQIKRKNEAKLFLKSLLGRS